MISSSAILSAPRCRRQRLRAARNCSANTYPARGGKSIADLRLTAKGKRLENQRAILVDFATGVGAGGPFRTRVHGYDPGKRPRASGLPVPFPGKISMDENLVSEQEASTARRGRAASGGAAARRAARSGGGPGTAAHLHQAQDQGLRGARRGRPRAHREQCRHGAGGDRHHLPRRRRRRCSCGRTPAPTSRASACISRRACRARCSKTAPLESTPSMRATRSARCRSAATPRSSRRSTARPSCATSTASAATPRSRISAIS